MIYTITLNPAIDCAMAAEDIALGRVNRVGSQALRFGGKGINVSYVLREFGGESVLTGFIAGFVGDALEAGLAREGFACDFVRLAEGNTRINVKLTSACTDGDPDTELNAPGPAPTADELSALTGKLSRISAGDAVVLAGSLPCGVSASFVSDITAALPEGARFICDLSGDALRAALTAKPDFVKPNVHELYDLLGIRAVPELPNDHEIIAKAAAQLVEIGACSVLVTMGGDGAYFADEHGNCGFIPSPAIPNNVPGMRSAVGCGDSAVAGWLIGMGFAGEDVRIRAFAAAGIDSGRPDSASRLAVAIGSASYYFGFPASPDKAISLDT